MSLRELAIILNVGREAAESIQDAGLCATLSAMTEVTVALAAGHHPLWDVEEEFAELVRKYT